MWGEGVLGPGPGLLSQGWTLLRKTGSWMVSEKGLWEVYKEISCPAPGGPQS